MSSLLLAGQALFVLGIAGMLVRRSLLVVIMSFQLCVWGAVLALVVFAAGRGDPRGYAWALVFVALGASWAILGAAAALAAFRRRGTPNLDELRELRG